MAKRCALTGKETQFGHNVSHSKRATNRRFAHEQVDVAQCDRNLAGREAAAQARTALLRQDLEAAHVAGVVGLGTVDH